MKKVLIANRGEIAVRVARACAEYGVASVAVYADPDAEAPHVAAATEAWGLPSTAPADTYLNIDALLDVAARSGADAVHPGYGFLSESAEFAARVIAAGLTWIGPSPESIAQLGDKVTARELAASVGAPLVAGSDGVVTSAAEVVAFAREHGLPVAIKAAFGGGGRGMRVARTEEEIPDLYDAAVREAVAAFGRGESFVEQFLENPRHVEVQVVGDGRGGVAVVGTRDCSVQRRNQKLVEEAPAPFLTDAQRTAMATAARDICAAVGYAGAGTVEFLVGANGVVSFLEVNTRLQVEHPVTEETAGVDLVRQQLLVADGLPLEIPLAPAEGPVEPLPAQGHAFEFRLNAEDPGRGFLPEPGAVTRFDLPGGPGVRVDAGVVAGSSVPGAYDSMLGKLIVWGPDRDAALRRARTALAELRIEGVPTVVPFHRRLAADAALAGDGASFGVHTRWIETECDWLDELVAPRAEAAPEGGITRTWIEVDGRRAELALPTALLGGLGVPAPAAAPDAAAPADPAVLAAPIAGTVVSWKAADGAEVAEGEVVAVMEAMKMETPVTAHRAGTLAHGAAAGAYLAAGAELGRIG
ncbi:acetyl/propionyl/methylcrotonyl-CoA carboxylase subunit alpha [Microbacterium sediminis]|uniref:acetyl/propionyl/methylcrotonyl-CoA carboxylase subunit alpha n=1 Tax=Microbacterium sediminis TaxID=904291 RepID=UPI001071E881|nr:biotin carboxylase N-terminal domain-containing protein [Microbacterium sediminis]QBR73227.1 ATP-grasp domain-containing protein [Microbacterium sediminis]